MGKSTINSHFQQQTVSHDQSVPSEKKHRDWFLSPFNTLKSSNIQWDTYWGTVYSAQSSKLHVVVSFVSAALRNI